MYLQGLLLWCFYIQSLIYDDKKDPLLSDYPA